MHRLQHVTNCNRIRFIRTAHTLPSSLAIHLGRYTFCSSSSETACSVKELSLDDLLSSASLDDVVPNEERKQSEEPQIVRNHFFESNSNDTEFIDDDILSEDDDDEIDAIIDELEKERDAQSTAGTTSTDSLTTTETASSALQIYPDLGAIGEHGTFRSMGLRKKLERNLHSVHGLSPLPIQSLAFERIGALSKEYAISGSIIESGMGTGKTLAYLLPIMNDLKPLQCGQAVIVVPSHELGVQIKSMLKSYLIHHHQHKVTRDKVTEKSKSFLLQHAVMSCGSNESLDFNMDYITKMSPAVIIGTPKRIRELLLYSVLKPSRINYIVFDEVDALFPIKSKYDDKKKQRRQQQLEHSHLKPSQLILNGILKQQSGGSDGSERERDHRCHVVFVGATIPNQLKRSLHQQLQPHPVELISSDFKSSEMKLHSDSVTRPRLISPNIVHQYVAVDGAADKPFIVAELIRKIRSDPKQRKLSNPAVLVFVAKESSPMEFAEALSEQDVKCAVLHEHCAEKAARSRFLKMFRNGHIEAVVATESVSRGLDFIWLEHLIVAEVPSQDTSYLHIAGRCSRLHSKGFVTSVVDEFDEERLKRHCFKYNIALQELDDDHKIEALSKQRRKYHKLNTFPLLLQNKEYHKKLKQKHQAYLPSSSSSII